MRIFTVIILESEQGDFICCGAKAVCSVTHINAVIVCIMRCDNDTVIHNLDVITNWNLATFRPRVVKWRITGCQAREETQGLLFTYH